MRNRIPRKLKKYWAKRYRRICKKNGLIYISFGKLLIPTTQTNSKLRYF